MTFGIRDKISLLVFLAAAVSALLVSRGLMNKSQEVYRARELIDLGDEAQLRGWTLSDRVDGLVEDLLNLTYDLDFNDAVDRDTSVEELEDMAHQTCRRYWADYVHMDIIQVDGDQRKVLSTIHSNENMQIEDPWLPDNFLGAQVLLSPILRLRIFTPPSDPLPKGRVHGMPVIWGIASLNRFTGSIDGPQNYIRIAAKLGGTGSPRNFYVLENEDGEILQRADEFVPPGEGNDAVFSKLSADPLVRNRLLKDVDPNSDVNQPRVKRLVVKEWVKLDRPYYYLEGVPNKELKAAISFDTTKNHIKALRVKVRDVGRVGGLNANFQPVRILADSRDKIAQVKQETESILEEHFEDEYDGLKWRSVVECDEIHSYSVQLLIRRGEDIDRYLIHYAVMEDELASSIKHVMRELSFKAFGIAGGAGALAFLIAMLFIRPLKEMTQTAQKITESKSENLSGQLTGMISSLATNRRDEVGEIARASKLLFEEVIESQEQLEQRVADRTAELRQMNIEMGQANEKLKSLSHEKDAFVAKVSHDLRQPLNAIFLQVEALKLSELDDLQKKDVNKIHSHATRELKLVNDILEYQKIIMGAETLVRDDIDVKSVVEDLKSVYEPNVQSGVRMELKHPDDIGVVQADERRLRQVLGNLISNACKFTKEGRVGIEVQNRTVQNQDWVEFTVIDSGRGMSPGEQAKAFVPFVSNKKDNAGGTGLGLSICKELTERMGGRIGFVSELGKGTSFSVLIPRIAVSDAYEVEPEVPTQGETPASSAKEAAARISQHADVAAGSKGAKVLVIDDEQPVREMLKRLLEGDGYSVITAEDGKQGLELARSEKPQAITLDVVMPGESDGWAVLKELKADPETEQIPVIMVSIMAGADNGFALDVEDYLVKPVDVDRLSRVVSRVTRSTPQRNLLIVDDDVESREVLGELLDRQGWQNTFASNGVEALEVLAKTRPAAIVLDLMMPEMDGFDFLRNMQQDKNLADIPVIVMTGKEPTMSEREFLEERVGMILKKDDDSGSQQVLQTITQRIRPPGN